MVIEEIRKAIHDKFIEWKNTIRDTRVRGLVERDTIITGGCIASMVLDEPVNDFDVYMKTEETAFLLARYYCDTVPILCYPVADGDKISIELPNKKALKKRKPLKGYNVAYISPLAITLTDKIQITVRFFGSPKKIHSTYDFLHATAYWTSHNNMISLPYPVLALIKSKKLVYVGSKYPIASIIRVKKFIKRDWTISAGQLLKMSIQASDLDLTDKDKLKEQLVGMYAEDLTEVVRDTKINKDGIVDRDSLFKAIDEHMHGM